MRSDAAPYKVAAATFSSPARDGHSPRPVARSRRVLASNTERCRLPVKEMLFHDTQVQQTAHFWFGFTAWLLLNCLSGQADYGRHLAIVSVERRKRDSVNVAISWAR